MADGFESFISLLGDDVSVRWLITLLHFLWQGAVVGGVVAIAGRLLRDASAGPRYALYSTALLSLPVCVAVTYCVVEVPTSLQPSSQLETPADISTMLSERVVINAATMKSVADDNSQSLSNSSAALLSRAAPWTAVAYVAGVACFLLRLLSALWGGHRLRSPTALVTDGKLLKLIADQAESVKLKCVPVVAYCERVAVPTVVGLLRPMVLLPVPLMSGLTPDDFAAIIRHELAHIRRYDLWMNLLQRVIESLLFFHPVVWFISRQLKVEREVCCDDLVVSSGYEPMHYAGALLRMAELCAISQQSGALGLAATGDKTPLLERRIERLMTLGNTPPPLRLTRAGMAGLLMTVASLVVVTFTMATLQARSVETDPQPERESSVRESRNAEVLRARGLVVTPDKGRLQLKVLVPAKQEEKVRVGSEAVVQIDAFPNRSIRGQVSSVIRLIEVVDSNRASSRSIKEISAILSLDEVPEQAIAGLTAVAEMASGSRSGVPEAVRARGVLGIPEEDRLQIDVSVPAKMGERIRVGASAVIQIDAFPNTSITGEVIQVGTAGSPNDEVSVILSVDELPGQAVAGLTAVAEIGLVQESR